MRAGAWVSRLAVAVLVAAGAAACAVPHRPAWTALPITDMASVSGKWGGVLLRDPAERQDDWLELTIGPGGAFQIKSFRLIGALTGSGTFTLAGGKVVFKGERASITGTLHTAQGRRMLRIDATTPEGFAFRSDTEPAP